MIGRYLLASTERARSSRAEPGWKAPHACSEARPPAPSPRPRSKKRRALRRAGEPPDPVVATSGLAQFEREPVIAPDVETTLTDRAVCTIPLGTPTDNAIIA